MSLLTGRFIRLCQEAEPKHFVLSLRSRKTDHDVVQFFPPLQVGSISSQSRASRNARLCQSVFRYTTHRQPQTRRAESLRCTSLHVYVGPRRSGQSLPPVPSTQVSAVSAEPFGFVILAGSNLLRLHFLQRLPSAGPTLTWEGQKDSA